MTTTERYLAFTLALVTFAWIAAAFVFIRQAKQDRHQYAYCFNGKFNLAYPCHENPFWSADL